MAAIERENGTTAAGREGEGSVVKAAWDMRRTRRTAAAAAAEEERRAAAIAGVGIRWRSRRDGGDSFFLRGARWRRLVVLYCASPFASVGLKLETGLTGLCWATRDGTWPVPVP